MEPRNAAQVHLDSVHRAAHARSSSVKWCWWSSRELALRGPLPLIILDLNWPMWRPWHDSSCSGMQIPGNHLCLYIGHSQRILPAQLWKHNTEMLTNPAGTSLVQYSPVQSQLTLPDLLQYPFITFSVCLCSSEREVCSLSEESLGGTFILSES